MEDKKKRQGEYASEYTDIYSDGYPEGITHAEIIKEAEPAYGFNTNGEYTIADYLALPDERRVELIDGVFYDMAAPTTNHQSIGGAIFHQLFSFFRKHRGHCVPFMSPVDVQLDRDDKTIVQPDVIIVCDRNKIQKKRIFGAPDFVVEVLSPSTRKKDIGLKLYKYTHAGVREYWIVDPERKTVVVYDLEHKAPPVLYGFCDKVPVLVWDSRCQVDFAEIQELFGFWMSK